MGSHLKRLILVLACTITCGLYGCTPTRQNPEIDQSTVIPGKPVAQPALPVMHAPYQTLVVLASDALFETASAQLKPEANQTLAQLLTLIKHNTQIKQINITAYTDDLLSQAQTQRITQLQANNVAAYLWEHHISSRIISAKGSLNNHSVSSNDSAVGSAENRHVTVSFNRFALPPLG